jgi:hypothetical protein
MTLYVLLKFVHVLLAIVAIGFNASYGVWLVRAGREPELQAYRVGSAEYTQLASRGRTLGIVMAVIVVVIEFLMVAKPTR